MYATQRLEIREDDDDDDDDGHQAERRWWKWKTKRQTVEMTLTNCDKRCDNYNRYKMT